MLYAYSLSKSGAYWTLFRGEGKILDSRNCDAESTWIKFELCSDELLELESIDLDGVEGGDVIEIIVFSGLGLFKGQLGLIKTKLSELNELPRDSEFIFELNISNPNFSTHLNKTLDHF